MRVLALIEAATVSGPVKNLLQFHETTRGTGLAPGVDIALATFQRDNSCNNSEFVEAVNACNIPLYRIRERFRFDPQVLPGLRNVIREAAPELIETHAVKSHFLVRISGIWKSFPWIAFCHGYTHADFRSPLYNSLDHWTLKVPKRIVAVSRAFEQELYRRGLPKSQVSVLHNAVSCARKKWSVDRVWQARQGLGVSSN